MSRLKFIMLLALSVWSHGRVVLWGLLGSFWAKCALGRIWRVLVSPHYLGLVVSTTVGSPMINERLPMCASDRPVTWTQPDSSQAVRRGKVRLREPLTGNYMGTWPPVSKPSLSQEAASPGCFGPDVLELVWLFIHLTQAKEVSQVPSQFRRGPAGVCVSSW